LIRLLRAGNDIDAKPAAKPDDFAAAMKRPATVAPSQTGWLETMKTGKSAAGHRRRRQREASLL
jgi:hypothetical protein